MIYQWLPDDMFIPIIYITVAEFVKMTHNIILRYEPE